MNSKERVEAVIRGRTPDRVPVCLHNFMPAAREAGVPLGKALSDPGTTARSHLEAVEKYGHDCILVDFDTTMLAEAMGATRDAVADGPGHIQGPIIKDLSEVGRLRTVDPERDGRIPMLLETIRLLADACGEEISIRGNADQCAFSLAALLRGMEDFLMDLTDPDEEGGARELLEVCYQSHLAVHRALSRAGAHFTSLGDSTAGPDVVSPAMFDRFARPYQERLVRDLAAEDIFVLIHICGNTGPILPLLAEYTRCGFELDYKTDAAEAKVTVGSNHVLFGNIDPSGVIGRGTPGEVREACRRLIESWKPRGGFVLNSGCAIPPSAPSENIAALVASAREFGVYER